jgi:hypothetical protein
MAMNIGLARRSANAADICGDNAGAWTAEAAVAAASALDVVAAWSGLDALDPFRRMNGSVHYRDSGIR